MRQLSGQDASFLYLESSGAHLHLTALYVYEQASPPHRPVGYSDFVHHVESRLDSSSLFRQKLVRPPLDLDCPFWVDDPDFDLQEHIHLHDGPAPGNRQELYQALAELHAEPLDLSVPPWEMHFFEEVGPLEGLPDHCFAVIAKYHHSAIDGASGSQLVDGLHYHRPTAVRELASSDWKAGHEPGVLELLGRAAISNVRKPIRLARLLSGAIPGMARSILKPDKTETDSDVAVPKTCFNDAISAERVFYATSIELDKIKAIRKAAPGATVNDVVLAVCGGGLRLWLEDWDELPPESLVAMVPVNARGSGEQSLGGNRLGTMLVPIHSDISSPLDRLNAIHRATDRAKSPESGLDPQYMSEITNQIPAITLATTGKLVTALGLGHRTMRLCNCTITNVPGPQNALYLGPAKLVYSTGSAPILDGMGLIISVFSYENEMTFSFTSCPEMLPDPEYMAQCTQEALELLLQDAGNRNQAISR